jgi:hypothetical protein
MINKMKISKKALKLTIGQLGHFGVIIPWVFHFLSCLRTLLTRAKNRRFIFIDKTSKNNLILMLSILAKAKEGIYMSLLAFWAPN